MCPLPASYLSLPLSRDDLPDTLLTPDAGPSLFPQAGQGLPPTATSAPSSQHLLPLTSMYALDLQSLPKPVEGGRQTRSPSVNSRPDLRVDGAKWPKMAHLCSSPTRKPMHFTSKHAAPSGTIPRPSSSNPVIPMRQYGTQG